MLYQLDYRVAVPTAFHLVKELALEIDQAAQGSQCAGARALLMPTPGHKLGHAPESRAAFVLLESSWWSWPLCMHQSVCTKTKAQSTTSCSRLGCLVHCA
eukprot:6385221-Amphidinium_carterae.1